MKAGSFPFDVVSGNGKETVTTSGNILSIGAKQYTIHAKAFGGEIAATSL